MDRGARPLSLLTGAAEGLGAASAGFFAQAGHGVVGVARTDRSAAAVDGVVRIRNPAGCHRALRSHRGAVYWGRTGPAIPHVT